MADNINFPLSSYFGTNKYCAPINMPLCQVPSFLPLSKRPQHFCSPEIGGSWPWYLLRGTHVVFDGKSARFCDPQVSFCERLDFWYWLLVFKISCCDTCFPKGLCKMERSDGNSRERPTVAAELLDRWILGSYDVCQKYFRHNLWSV